MIREKTRKLYKNFDIEFLEREVNIFEVNIEEQILELSELRELLKEKLEIKAKHL